MTAGRFLGADLKTFGAIAVLLVTVAFLAPAPDRTTDRDTYEATATHGVVADCSDLQCFRVLVAWTLGVLPGRSVPKWKIYAAFSNAAAAVVLGQLCRSVGLSTQVAAMSTWATAFGFGSLYTLYDPFSSDPLMFLMGPLLTLLLLRGRLRIAALVGALGVLAKEFAAVPLFVFALAAAMRRQWPLALRALASANAALLVWMSLQFWLMLRFNYTYSNSASTQLLSGGNLVGWLSRLSPRLAVSSVFTEFGAIWLLAPAGFFLGPSTLRWLSIAAIPPALLFSYVQQPDRALWNFHYLIIPLAMIAASRLPTWWSWALVGFFAFANLRLGGQLAFVPAARLAVLVSVVIAAVAVVRCWREPATWSPAEGPEL